MDDRIRKRTGNARHADGIRAKPSDAAPCPATRMRRRIKRWHIAAGVAVVALLAAAGLSLTAFRHSDGANGLEGQWLVIDTDADSMALRDCRYVFRKDKYTIIPDRPADYRPEWSIFSLEVGGGGGWLDLPKGTWLRKEAPCELYRYELHGGDLVIFLDQGAAGLKMIGKKWAKLRRM